MKRYVIILIAFVFSSHRVVSQTLKTKLTDHTANVETIAYSGDGKYFASSGWDGVVNLYTIDSLGIPRIKRAFTGHLGAVTSLNFSQNNRYLISCGKDFSARLWNLDFPDSSKTFNLHFEPVTNAFLDRSGKNLITCSTDGTIKTTNIYDSKKSKSTMVGKPISDLIISRDGKFYYIAVKGGSIIKMDVATGNKVEDFTAGHKDDVNTLDLSPDGNYLASGSSDKTIIIWDLMTGKEVKKMTGFEWKVTCIEYSQDGRYIIGGCNDGAIKLFDVATGKLMADFVDNSKNVRDVAFSANQSQIAVATNLETDKFGALIFNSGVTYVKPEPVNKGKVVKPAPKGGNTVKKPAPGTKPNSVK